MEEDLGLDENSNRFQLAVSILFVTYCVRACLLLTFPLPCANLVYSYSKHPAICTHAPSSCVNEYSLMFGRIIKKLQPARYLAGLTFCWGLTATFSAFVNNFAALIACRLLLGVFEGT